MCPYSLGFPQAIEGTWGPYLADTVDGKIALILERSDLWDENIPFVKCNSYR